MFGLKSMTVILIFACSALAGCSNATPQAVFDEANKCAEGADYGGLCRCLTPEGQDQMAALMVVAGVMQQKWAPSIVDSEKMEAELAEMKKVLEKHNVNPDDVKSSIFSGTSKQSDWGKEIKSVAAAIQNKPEFVADVMNVGDSSWKDFKVLSDKIPFGNAKLEDLKSQGDSATGVMVNSRGKQLLKFVKREGMWLIAPDLDLVR